MNAPAFRPSDFFLRQDEARRRTRWLVLWFAAGLLGTLFGVYGACLLGFHLLSKHMITIGLWHPKLFLGCAGGTLLVVGGASLMKSMSLAGGGGEVARSVGGRRVEPDTTDTDERRLLNIVEEMSIASGVPMPEVYLLDRETAINAFAAGDSIENAAVAVTRGALHKLTRDELQAVMGHEFSHILNGDMRLNLRLIGWIAGLVALTVVARILMDTGNQSSWLASRRDDRKNGAALMFVGLAILIVGLMGQLFAQIIQAAISRQREHLADASATQFTRNPDALANALRRIGGDAIGSRLADAHASEIAHMCFGESVSSMFATHPPLAERIRHLSPDWDGTYLPAAPGAELHFAPPTTEEEIDREFRSRYVSGGDAATAATGGSRLVGETAPPLPRPAPRLAPAVVSLLHTPLGARSAIILLLMTDNPADNRAQAELVKRHASDELFQSLKTAWGAVHGVAARDRLALVQQAAPALRRLSAREADDLLALLRALANSDGTVSFFEVALIRSVAAITHPADDRADETRPAALAPALRTLLTALLLAGTEEHDQAEAFVRAARLAPGFGPLGAAPDASGLSSESLENAFATLARATFELRGQVIAAAEFIAGYDGEVNQSEADLLAALASALRCPTTVA